MTKTKYNEEKKRLLLFIRELLVGCRWFKPVWRDYAHIKTAAERRYNDNRVGWPMHEISRIMYSLLAYSSSVGYSNQGIEMCQEIFRFIGENFNAETFLLMKAEQNHNHAYFEKLFDPE